MTLTSINEVKEAIKDPLADKIIKCESSYTPNVYGDNGLAWSVGQFHEESFYRMRQAGIKAGEPFIYLDYRNAQDQITLLTWAVHHGFASEWSCYHLVK